METDMNLVELHQAIRTQLIDSLDRDEWRLVDGVSMARTVSGNRTLKLVRSADASEHPVCLKLWVLTPGRDTQTYELGDADVVDAYKSAERRFIKREAVARLSAIADALGGAE